MPGILSPVGGPVARTPMEPIARMPMRPYGGMPDGPRAMPLARPMMYKKGGKVKKTGWAIVHKGEKIKPAGAAANAMGGKKKKAPKTKRAKAKIKKTMGEWRSGTLHSGSKTGPKVTSQKQAVAIAISQAKRKA